MEGRREGRKCKPDKQTKRTYTASKTTRAATAAAAAATGTAVRKR